MTRIEIAIMLLIGGCTVDAEPPTFASSSASSQAGPTTADSSDDSTAEADDSDAESDAQPPTQSATSADSSDSADDASESEAETGLESTSGPSGELDSSGESCGDGCGSCGDGAVDADELCDGDDVGASSCTTLGFGEGTLGCNASCTAYDTTGCTACTEPGDPCVIGRESCCAGSTCQDLGNNLIFCLP